MKISETVQSIVGFLSSYSEQRITDIPVLSMLLQYAGDDARYEELGTLCFLAKHVCRLLNMLERQKSDSDILQKLQEESAASIRKFAAALTEFIHEAPEELRTTVNSRHLMLNPDGFRHLVILAHDLEWLKNWELDMARQSPEI